MTEIEISCKVKELYLNKKYKEALALLSFETNNTVLLNQKLSIYITLEEFAKAKETYNNIKQPDHCTFKYYKILKTEISKKAHLLSSSGGQNKGYTQNT